MDDRQWIESYQANLRARGLKAATIRDRRYPLQSLFRWMADRGLRLEGLEPRRIHEHLLWLKSKGRAPSTVAGSLADLRGFIRYALKQGIVTADPTQGVSCGWLDTPGGYPAYRGILREIFERPAAVANGHLPLFAPHWENYLRHLRDAGYSRWHVVKSINCVSHFHEFLRRRRLRLRDVAFEQLKEFLGQKGRLRSRHDGRVLKQRFFENARRTIASFLRYAGLLKPVEAPPLPQSRALPPKLLAAYSRFCRTHRGLRPTTITVRLTQLTEFGLFLDLQGLDDMRSLGVRHLDAFLREVSRRMKPVSLRAFVSSLRSFLRYLQLRGVLSKDLSRLVMSPVRFRRDRIPRYLPWKKVQRALESVDRSVLSGKRDYAILTLMACHGLRNGEVGGLLLSDIDWDKSAVLLRERKAGDTQELPISPATREALRDYITARPKSPHPYIFLNVAAPFGPVGTHATAVVERRLRRCLGDERPHYGAHLLRHSFAKALLDQGARITDVKALLGHQNLESTHVYTQIATEDLQEVADNYANFLTPHNGAPL
jgi:site-specific recombinase XerD